MLNAQRGLSESMKWTDCGAEGQSETQHFSQAFEQMLDPLCRVSVSMNMTLWRTLHHVSTMHSKNTTHRTIAIVAALSHPSAIISNLDMRLYIQ